MNEQFTVPLNGLAKGWTRFSLFAGKEFFSAFGNEDVLDAGVKVDVGIEKSGDYLGVDLSLDGFLTVPCDRCLEPVRLNVDCEARLSVKSGSYGGESPSGTTEDGREIVCLEGESAVLDLSQTVYDYALLSLPMRKVHPEGECAAAAASFLSSEEEAPSASPFASLKGLFDGK